MENRESIKIKEAWFRRGGGLLGGLENLPELSMGSSAELKGAEFSPFSCCSM